jgi:membrane-associated phospholipid phosphatase
MFELLRKLNKYLHPVDRAVMVYILITAGINIYFFRMMGSNYSHLLIRFIIVATVAVLILLNEKKPSKIVSFLWNFYPLFTLAYFYGETFFYNQLFFNYFDPYISWMDQHIFGFQPSLEFSRVIHWAWFNELMNFAYFSYYLMIFGLCFAVFKMNRSKFDRTIHAMMQSFFIYYLIFIFFPVMGPQFWFPEPLNKVSDAGMFRELVKIAQDIGEYPTGAFPSSHVGMSLILCILSYKYVIRLFPFMVTISVLLSLSAVYIKAHYAFDIIGGALTAPFIYWLSMRIYRLRLVEGPLQRMPLRKEI